MLAVFCSIASHYVTIASHRSVRSLTLIDILGSFFILLGACLISFITESRRKVAEELQVALSSLQERTDALVESLNSSKCASWIIDLDSGKSARWYSGSYPVFGRPFSEIEQAPSLRPYLHPDDQPRLSELVQHMKTSYDPIVFEYRAPWPNGEIHWLEARSTRVPGKGCIWRGVTVDITERKLAESAILRSEKLAAMGRLASTVAHEINNPLESVTNLLYLARTDPGLSSQTQAFLETAESELKRLANITRLTLGFVRTAQGSSDVDLAEVIESVLSIFRSRCEMKKIQIEPSYQTGVCVVLPPHEMRQIATNLIANAIDAVTTNDPRIGVRIFREGERSVFILEDNGVGIDPAHQGRIFEPFFTTKEDTGTGIGLWVTRELVQKNGGTIKAESGDLSGGMKTRFRIEFAAASPPSVEGDRTRDQAQAADAVLKT